MKNERIVRHSASELAQQSVTSGDGIDWAKVKSLTDAELDALIASDPDDDGRDIPEDAAVLASVTIDLPLSLLRHLPALGPDRNREVSRIVAAHLRRKAARVRSAS
jgi:hypothetical protein